MAVNELKEFDMDIKTSHDSEVLADGQQVITACALIHKNENGVAKVFMPRRAKTKKFLPDVFELPGGHIDFGEDLVKGLAREIDEEFGMKVKIGSPFAAFTYVNDVKKSHSAEVIYFATFVDGEDKITLEPSDHSEYLWISLDEISKVYTEAKGADDEEFVCLRNGLELLNGGSMNYGV